MNHEKCVINLEGCENCYYDNLAKQYEEMQDGKIETESF